MTHGKRVTIILRKKGRNGKCWPGYTGEDNENPSQDSDLV